MSNWFDYIQYASYTNKGLVRGNNEDSLLCMPETGCFAVADGMGGGEAGEVASAYVVESLQKAWQDTLDDSPGTRKYAVQQCLHQANGRIVRYAHKHEYNAMGSTVVLIQFDPWQPDQAFVCHVGDSPLFCLRGGELFRLTRDHSVGEEIKAKNLPMQSVSEKMAKALTRVIGAERLLVPEWQVVSVCPNDIFLLTSDGVTAVMSDADIEKALAGNVVLADTLEAMATQVLVGGAPDNFTMVAMQVAGELPLPPAIEDWEREESDLLLKVAEERKDYGNC